MVIDEVHIYRGVFGSHVANVIRRLRRVCRPLRREAAVHLLVGDHRQPGPARGGAYRASRFAWSTTTALRGGRSFSSSGTRRWSTGTTSSRRSANVEASELLAEVMKWGSSSIVFSRARIVAELIHRYASERLRRDKRHASLAGRIAPYRGGYLPEDRRRIEKELFSGKLLAVSSTNALELGIDVGSLDVAITVGFPGTIAGMWQQAGRAGRRGEESLAILVAYDEPIDQYIAHRADYLFERPVEEAIVDQGNPYVLQGHLLCAAAERPLEEEDLPFFGEHMPAVADALERTGRLKRIANRYYVASAEMPAQEISLRLISSDTYEIVDTGGDRNRVIGNVDSISAPELVYPGAVYLHEGQSYLCDDLDVEGKIAYVKQAEVDYYTQPILSSTVSVTAIGEEKDMRSTGVALGDIDVTWATVAFKKIRFSTMEMIGQGELDLPAQTLATRAFWLTPAAGVLEAMKDLGYHPLQGLVGAKNLLQSVLAMVAMADPHDIWGIVNSRNTASYSIFIYDRYPGGIGYAEKGYDRVEELLSRAVDIIRECPCGRGCPSCVGLANLRFPIHQDPDLYGGAGPIPEKDATRVFLDTVLAELASAKAPKPL